LVATAIGRNKDPRPASLVLAPFERDPTRWTTLPWRFAANGELVPFDKPDSAGTSWRLRTLHDFLSSYARHPIAEMLAPDGSRCGPYTRGLLQPRPTRDGERWLILKESAVWGDDPRHAFSVPSPEAIRRRATRGQDAPSAAWESSIKPALVIVGPAAVARKMGIAERSARAWAAGGRQPENPGEVAPAIVATAREAGLGLPSDEHLRAEEICGELPRRGAVVQVFIAIVTCMLAERQGGVRALARAMAAGDGSDNESMVRRWIALAQGELRLIIQLNRIVARLAKFSRAEIKMRRRRIQSEAGPVGDRQAILAHISLLHGAEKPVVLTAEEMLAFPIVLAVAGALAVITGWIAEWLRARQGSGNVGAPGRSETG
jgi:hypothetical protein